MLGAEAASDFHETLSLGYIFERPLEVLWPMTLGAIPTAVAVWIGFFWPVRGVVAEYQHARRWRVRRKVRTRLARREAKQRDERIRAAVAAGQEQEEA